MINNLKNNNKGFTLIELIVVIAIIGVLVLLATPKFINYLSEAKEANIINDIKVMENKIEEYLIRNDDNLPNDWTSLGDNSILSEAVEQDKLYSIKGLVDNVPVGIFKEVPNTFINTKLKGSFYVNEKDAVVYYISNKDVEEKEPEIEADDPSDFYYLIKNNEIVIIDYLGMSKDIVIPAKIEGYPVTKIGIDAFSMRGNFDSIIIPDTVEVLENQSLSFANFKYVKLPANLITIETSALEGNKITEIIIPQNVVKIGHSAFRRNKLTEVIIPDSVETIGASAFIDNPLSKITIGTGVNLHSTAISNNFADIYNVHGAGTYILNTDNGTWTKQ